MKYHNLSDAEFVWNDPYSDSELKCNNHTYNIYVLHAEYGEYLEENNLNKSEIDFDTWLNIYSPRHTSIRLFY